MTSRPGDGPAPARPVRPRWLQPPTWRGEAPTEPLPVRASLRRTPYRNPRVRRTQEERVAMDLALNVGEVLLRCGASAAQTHTSVVAVSLAAGLERIDVDITLQSLLMQVQTADGEVATRLRVVGPPRWDFGRLAAVHALVDDLVSGEVTVAQAVERMQEIHRAPRTWSSWVVALATGLLAAGVAVVLGAGVLAAVLCIGSAILVDRLVGTLSGLGIPDFYASAAGGFVATAIAYGAYALGYVAFWSITPADFAAMVAGGIIALLPARSIASAMEDVVTGYPVTGTSRIFSVLFHTLGLIIGVGSALPFSVWVATRAGQSVAPPAVERLASTTVGLPVALAGAAAIGIFGAITMQSRRRYVLPAGGLTVVGVLVTRLLTSDVGVGRVTAVGLTAIIIGFLARVVALRMGAPALVLAVPGSFGLLPGLAIFVGLYRLLVTAGGDLSGSLTIQVGAQELISAVGVLIAIATGNTLGDLLASPLDHRASMRRTEAPDGAGERG
ncbi:threonine/serine exporter family protein [Nostocoides australiense]|nr:threonine/serine exporter family protein [Actinomycetota bacterium]MCB1252755.1 threonine/serine exporter family protein [Austwickia sp.]HPF81749.1 threonine/serine exporter family protein [Tetrasphaera australiensis]HRW03237.1 threonine/serine exporter family protein [Tetrasphaera sp.]